MTGEPAPSARRRVPRGLLGALVVFLFLPFPPLFLVGPLAGRLLMARPRSVREWSWFAASVLILLLAFGFGPDAMAQKLVQAAGLVFTGTFLALLAWRPGPAFPHAVRATAFTTGVIMGGTSAAGVQWEAFRTSVRQQLADATALLPGTSAMPPEQAEAFHRMLDHVARLYPGLAVLGALAGGTLAAGLAIYVAARPGDREPGRFGHFRFNDHVIWGALLTLALAMAPLAAPWNDLVANALVVWAGLYMARGAAVLVTIWARWPGLLRIALCMLAVVLLHFALGGLLLLGLADTWLDFRRRFPPPDSQGVTA
jgi:hypothetical protein